MSARSKEEQSVLPTQDQINRYYELTKIRDADDRGWADKKELVEEFKILQELMDKRNR